ncbi:MAG: hypothetical protein J2P48_11760 [Alphaproteobacteria bacterium]|nr:hypothetical protein [Alphaproteobacteria bacterium]
MATHWHRIACPAEVVAKPPGVLFSNVAPIRFSSIAVRALTVNVTDGQRTSGSHMRATARKNGTSSYGHVPEACSFMDSICEQASAANRFSGTYVRNVVVMKEREPWLR